nr:MAG TPA: hypothetical protein [Herelleviridae sp.]
MRKQKKVVIIPYDEIKDILVYFYLNISKGDN